MTRDPDMRDLASVLLVERNLKADLREVRKWMRATVEALTTYVEVLDAIGKMPASIEKGKALAGLANKMEFARDSLSYFGLGRPLKRVSKTERRGDGAGGSKP